jgi:hypothetical protein
MKVTYYTYYLAKENGIGQVVSKHHFDLKAFLTSFVGCNAPEFKRGFEIGDEHLYLFRVNACTFMFVMTKNHEIIKTIDSQSINVGDVYNRLQQHEELGFASYIYAADYFYGIGSTFQGPKNTLWTDFVNQILQAVGLRHYGFVSTALPTKASKAQVLRMPFVGRTNIEVDTSNSIGAQIAGMFGQNVNELDGFEVILKPKRAKSIKPMVAGALESMGETGIRKCVVKAKATIEDQLRDFYIIGQGYVCDEIDSREEHEICQKLAQKVQNNRELQAKISDHATDGRIADNGIQDLARFYQPAHWVSVVDGN